MLQRAYRLRKQRDFSRVFHRGRTEHAPAFTIKYHPNRAGRNRVAVVASTKVAKRAVLRNRTRRRFYACLQRLWPELESGFDIIILVRRQALDLRGRELERQLRSCFRRAGILH